MEFYETVKQRRSIRGYRSEPVPAAALERIGEAVRLAPSACNRQPWLFRVLVKSELREKVCGVYTQTWLREAPAIVVALGNQDECWKRLEGTPSTDIDIGIAMEHLVLAAAAEGLGSCWICAFDRKKMADALGIMTPWSVVAITPLGYAKAAPQQLQRKSLREIFAVIE